MKSFGERLMELRLSKKMNRRELSDNSGISYVQVTNYETGNSYPTYPAILKLSSALEISPKQFFLDEFEREELKSKIDDLLENYGEDMQIEDLEAFYSIVDSFLKSRKARDILHTA